LGLVLSAAAMFGTVIFLCSIGFLLTAQTSPQSSGLPAE
jgi:uncharacterized membrane protein YczE